MGERGCGCWLRITKVQFLRIFHKDANDTNEMQLKLSQQLFNCDDVRVDFDEDSKIGYGIYDMKMLKQNIREKNCKYQQKPREEQQKLLKNPS